MELTDIRAKPAVYFGGKSRIIDFALSNALNSGIRRIGVATQYKAHSLIRHLQRGWNFFRPTQRELRHPARQPAVSEDQWYAGTADAVYQNIDIIESYGPEYIVLLAGDHIYKMDYEPMLQQHVEQGADVTVGLHRGAADGGDGLRRHARRRAGPHHLLPREARRTRPACPDKPDMALASMGIYVFETGFLFDQLRRDAADPNSAHDFGKDIIPYLVEHGKAVAHRFAHSCVESGTRAEAYWRDVGTVDAYWEANIDLTDFMPALDLYDQRLADLDLRRDHAAGQVRPRRGGPPRHRRSTRSSRAAASSPAPGCALAAVHRRARPLLRRARGRRRAALCRDRPPAPG